MAIRCCRRSLLASVAGFLALESAAAVENFSIGWSDLLPAGAAIPAQRKISATPSAETREFKPAAGLDGKTVELSGYLLPADLEDGMVYAFMLVPRSGACSHMTQPPPSQVVRVVPEEPYKLAMNYEPVSVTGELTPGLEKTQLFILDGVAVIESGYSIRRATVKRIASPASARPKRPASPWSFLPDAPE